MTTLTEIGDIKCHNNAITRWAKFGPYYAMFPIDFAFQIVSEYSKEGDYIIDPFAGRFSSVYAGGVLGRHSIGIEINPLGWLYGKTKLSPAPKEKIQAKLIEVYQKREDYKEEVKDLSEFFHLCYCDEVLKFLLSARENLNWQRSKTDATLMSFLLVSLHGKLGEGLSNQMRQTKAMGMNYSINWWKKNGYETPPEINPYEFIRQRIERRYKKGVPLITTDCQAILGDSTKKLKEIVAQSEKQSIKHSLLFTSPPYHSVVDYHADQWLRLWLLKEDLKKTSLKSDRYKKRFNSKDDYENLLESVFGACAKIMHEKSVIFVRTDIREFTYTLTLKVLKKYFPNHKIEESESATIKKNQTELFNNISKKKEIDIKLTS
jgi:DNA modification methylase